MEKFEDYRNNLANELKETRKENPEKAQDVLDLAKGSEEFKEAKKKNAGKRWSSNYLKFLRKVIYKNPSFQNEKRDELSAEELEFSENVALSKLEKIKDPSYKDFSVRYMNIEEYRDLLSGKPLKGEVVLYGSNGRKNISAWEFLDRAKKDVNETDWTTMSGHALDRGAMYREWISRIYSKKDETDKTQSLYKLRESILEKWESDPLILSGVPLESIKPSKDYVPSEISFSKIKDFLVSDQLPDMEKQIRERLWQYFYSREESDYQSSDRVREQQIADELIEQFQISTEEEREHIKKYVFALGHEIKHGEENFNIYKKLKQDPEYILGKGNITKVIDAFTYSSDYQRSASSRQYHVAVVLDNAAFNFTPYSERHDIEAGLPHWAELNMKDVPKDKVAGSVLAVVNIMENYMITDELIELNKRSTEFANPVFLWNSLNLEWPTKEAVEKQSIEKARHELKKKMEIEDTYSTTLPETETHLTEIKNIEEDTETQKIKSLPWWKKIF